MDYDKEHVLTISENIVLLPNNVKYAMLNQHNDLLMYVHWETTHLPYPNVLLFGGNVVAEKIICNLLKVYKPNAELLLIGDSDTLINGRTPSAVSIYNYTTCIKINNIYIRLKFDPYTFRIRIINENETNFLANNEYDSEHNFKKVIDFKNNTDVTENINEIINILNQNYQIDSVLITTSINNLLI